MLCRSCDLLRALCCFCNLLNSSLPSDKLPVTSYWPVATCQPRTDQRSSYFLFLPSYTFNVTSPNHMEAHACKRVREQRKTDAQRPFSSSAASLCKPPQLWRLPSSLWNTRCKLKAGCFPLTLYRTLTVYKDGDMRAPYKWGQNLSIAPWWWTAVQGINSFSLRWFLSYLVIDVWPSIHLSAIFV